MEKLIFLEYILIPNHTFFCLFVLLILLPPSKSDRLWRLATRISFEISPIGTQFLAVLKLHCFNLAGSPGRIWDVLAS